MECLLLGVVGVFDILGGRDMYSVDYCIMIRLSMFDHPPTYKDELIDFLLRMERQKIWNPRFVQVPISCEPMSWPPAFPDC